MLLIFDWDGTLADSTHKIVKTMQAAAQSLALPALADKNIRDIIGLGLPEAIADIYPRESAAAQLALKEAYSQEWLARDRTPSPFFPKVLETLEHFKAQGHTLTVATGKSRRGLDRVLDSTGTKDFFVSSRCADETTSKPHPHMLHELLEEFKVDAAQALMIGDTSFDMEMAQRANVPRIAVSYGAHDVKRLQQFELLACIDRFDQLLDHIG